MKLIDSKVELVEQKEGLEGLYKHIELIGRVCTKSEDKITDKSYEKFVQNLKKANHGAVLEHGTIYLTVPLKEDGKPNNETTNIWSFFLENPYSECTGDENNIYITTNYRVLFEAGSYYMRYLKYMTPPTEHHIKRFTMHFILSRAIANEFERHRHFSAGVHFSYMQESTRYVNYKEGIEFIKPEWLDIEYKPWDGKATRLAYDPSLYSNKESNFFGALEAAEMCYRYAINLGLKPQEARDMLPLATKTELYMTGTIDQWKHFFSLRSPKYGAQGVHPDAAKLADQVYDLLKEYIDEG